MSAESILHLTYNTRQTRDWSKARDFFLARDRFLHAMIKRDGRGTVFAQYRSPDGSLVSCPFLGDDFRQHSLVLGGTGAGKSSLLEAMARTLLRLGRSFILIDPHGDLAHRVERWVRTSSRLKLVALDFTHPSTLPAWNPIARMDDVEPSRQVDLLVSVLKRLYAGEKAVSWAWGVKIEEIVRVSLRGLIESDRAVTLLDLERLLTEEDFRIDVLQSAGPEVQAYFRDRFGAREEMYVSAVVNKLSPLLDSPAVRAFLGRPQTTFDLLGCIDRPVAVVVNLARGSLGAAADVLGRLLTNSLLLASLRRERQVPEIRRPVTILVDEAHSFAGEESGLADLLVVGRKYKVSLVLAAQGLSLFPPRLRTLLTGNTGRQYFFRLPYAEARLLGPDILEPLGNIPRERVRPYDLLTDPLLTPDEEIRRRTHDLADLPRGACYWALRGTRYKARRVQILRPENPPNTLRPSSTGFTIDAYPADRPARGTAIEHRAGMEGARSDAPSLE